MKPEIISITFGMYLEKETIRDIILMDLAITMNSVMKDEEPVTLKNKLESLYGVVTVSYPHKNNGIEIKILEDPSINDQLLWVKIAATIEKHLKGDREDE